MADRKHGIAIQKMSVISRMVTAIFSNFEDHSEADQVFATDADQVIREEEDAGDSDR